jgi:hypothetical protein
MARTPADAVWIIAVVKDAFAAPTDEARAPFLAKIDDFAARLASAALLGKDVSAKRAAWVKAATRAISFMDCDGILRPLAAVDVPVRLVVLGFMARARITAPDEVTVKALGGFGVLRDDEDGRRLFAALIEVVNPSPDVLARTASDLVHGHPRKAARFLPVLVASGLQINQNDDELLRSLLSESAGSAGDKIAINALLEQGASPSRALKALGATDLFLQKLKEEIG